MPLNFSFSLFPGDCRTFPPFHLRRPLPLRNIATFSSTPPRRCWRLPPPARSPPVIVSLSCAGRLVLVKHDPPGFWFRGIKNETFLPKISPPSPPALRQQAVENSFPCLFLSLRPTCCLFFVGKSGFSLVFWADPAVFLHDLPQKKWPRWWPSLSVSLDTITFSSTGPFAPLLLNEGGKLFLPARPREGSALASILKRMMLFQPGAFPHPPSKLEVGPPHLCPALRRQADILSFFLPPLPRLRGTPFPLGRSYATSRHNSEKYSLGVCPFLRLGEGGPARALL